MKQISSSEARKNISVIINYITETGEPFVISRQNNPEVLILKMPKNYNKDINSLTHIQEYAGAFDFLEDEPDLYSANDLLD
jgi:hypothetical protein